MITALPPLHGHHQQLALGPVVVHHVVPPAPARLRIRLHHMAMAFALAVGVTALLLTVAAFAMAARTPSTDHSRADRDRAGCAEATRHRLTHTRPGWSDAVTLLPPSLPIPSLPRLCTSSWRVHTTRKVGFDDSR